MGKVLMLKYHWLKCLVTPLICVLQPRVVQPLPWNLTNMLKRQQRADADSIAKIWVNPNVRLVDRETCNFTREVISSG